MEAASIRFPPSLLFRLDNAFGPLGYTDRSELVRAAVREKLRRERDVLPPEAQPGAVPADA